MIRSRIFTILLGVSTLCAWGSLGEIVKALLRDRPIDSLLWVMFGAATASAIVVWSVFRASGVGLEVRSFIGSVPLGVVLLCSLVGGFVLPSLLVGGADVIEVAVTAVVITLVCGGAMLYLRKAYFTPPDSLEGLDDE
ncbi:hypothetical protein QYM46_11400 [Brevibacterium sp. K11IcPPYGO002]|uniref:hypothetical protein n=1 Tax=Brevibacterium sp. K11IcPPYGO002 TaxID=3058837 RepID=UPI003D8134C2